MRVTNRYLWRRNSVMKFFENTRKPQGFGGKLMTKMMNSGHAKLSQWGFSNISAKSDAERSGQGRNNLSDCTERF